MPKRRKALAAAVDAALAKVCTELHQQFTEFTTDEIARAVFKHAGARREREARKAKHAAMDAAMEEWWLKRRATMNAETEQLKRQTEERQQQEIRERHQASLKAAEDRAKEQKRKQALARKIIDAGYRAVAKELHPDVGGDTDAMSRSNEIRNRLKQVYG